MPRLASRQQRCGSAARRPDPTSPGVPSPGLLAAAAERYTAVSVDATAPFAARRTANARLLVTAGPSKGSEFAVVGAVVTVGRAARNAVVISDISVSRQHLRLEQKGRGWFLVDSASGNGTCVNGHVVRRRGLRDGDEIAIGDTALRFLEPGGVIVWRDAERSARSLARRRRVCLHGALAVAVVLVVAAAFIRRHRALDEAEGEQRRNGLHALARQKLQEGNALLKEGRRAEARAALMVSAELDGADAEIARALQSFEAEAHAAGPSAAVPDTVATVSASAAAAKPSHFSRESQVPAASASQAADVPEGDGKRALAERHLLAARELRSEEDLPRAAAHLRAALDSDPENAAAHLEMERVVERVREIYLRAYVAKDEEPEAARNGFARVAGALPAGDALAEKAARWLERLDGRGPR
jgi:type III secretion system (T3SS) inner membrane Yop/YscD-like protein